MLSSILAKSDCAACKFCCSFRRTSLWETPVFPAADLPKFQALNPDAKFRRPLRAVRQPDGNIKVALTPTCPAINKVSPDRIRDLAASGLGRQILDYAEEHPDIIKENSNFLSKVIYP